MDDRIKQFRVGVVVLATSMIAVILVIWLGELPEMFQARDTVTIRFTRAPGVSQGTPVRKFGLRIGEVTDVAFADDQKGVIVTATVRHDHVLTNDVCQIRGSLLGGDAILQFVPAGDPDDVFIQDGAELIGTTGTDPLQLVGNLEASLEEVVAKVGSTAQSVDLLAQDVRRILQTNETKLNQIVDNTNLAMTDFREVAGSVNELLNDPAIRGKLRDTIAELPEVLKGTRDTLATMNEAMELVQGNLRNLSGLTKPLGDRGPELVNRIDRGLEHLELLLARMAKFSDAVNNSEGSLGQIVNNPDLYQNLNRAAQRVDGIMAQLQPVVNDLRVFSDKIARHPGELSSGILQRRAGIKSGYGDWGTQQ